MLLKIIQTVRKNGGYTLVHPVQPNLARVITHDEIARVSDVLLVYGVYKRLHKTYIY